jgi:hypothetical protein
MNNIYIFRLKLSFKLTIINAIIAVLLYSMNDDFIANDKLLLLISISVFVIISILSLGVFIKTLFKFLNNDYYEK